MKKFIASVFLLLSSSSLMATTIDFDAFPSSDFLGGVEDGFTISVDAGSDLNAGSDLIPDSDFLGPFSGASSLRQVSITQSGITLTNGGLFEFSSLQSGSFFGGAEPLTVTGIFSGGIVGTDTFNPSKGSYSLFSAVNLLGVALDTLHIDMGTAAPGPTHIDDIVLNTASSPVPAPAAVWLFASGLIGLVGMKRKSAKLSSNFA
jgi:hypothetical protein